VNGFYLINKGKPYAFRPYMEQVLTTPDIQYIEKTAPKQEDGVNFIAWTDEVFAR
jgi:hypothetical protein